MIFFALKISRGGVCCMPAALLFTYVNLRIEINLDYGRRDGRTHSCFCLLAWRAPRAYFDIFQFVAVSSIAEFSSNFAVWF